MLVNGEELTVLDRYTQWPPIMTGLEFWGIVIFLFVFREAVYKTLGGIIGGLVGMLFTLLFLPFRMRKKKQKPEQEQEQEP